MTNEALARFFDRAILFFQLLLVIGIPLFFNSFTRSVFEVNKLLFLRVSTVSIMALWLTKYLLLWGQTYLPHELLRPMGKNKKRLKKNALAELEAVEAEPLVVRSWWWFRPLGIEWILVAWCLTNLMSTFFSTNFYTAVIGAYDRWEGIGTIINYLCVTLIFTYNVTRQRQFFVVLSGIVLASFLTSLYGIAQSLGYDFMNWSSDPTQRIFASINNPVHYCAFVGMMVPVVSGWLLWQARRQGTQWGKVGLELIGVSVILLIYYLGLFRINWEVAVMDRVHYLFLGMVVAALLLGILARRMGYQGTLFAIVVLIYYAEVLSYSRATWLGFFAAMIYFFIVATRNFSISSRFQRVAADFFVTVFAVGVFFMLYLFRVYNISWLLGAPLVLLLLAYIVFLFYCLRSWREVLLRCLIIFAFAQLQNVTLGFGQIALYLAAGAGIFAIIWKRFTERQLLQWLMILYAAYVVVPTFLLVPSMWHQLVHARQNRAVPIVTENIQSKVESIKNIAVEGSARSSMWKSSIAWWKDYPLFGTGPDTVKYMYPKYRREDYGLLEGGHNFTPDKVHNEYFNMLITRGASGFIIYYIGIVGFFIVTTVRGILRNRDNPFIFMLGGLLAGSFVYLGQVFFNFGVVATLSLFYTLTALAMALVYRHEALVEGQNMTEKWKPYFSWEAVPTLRLYSVPVVWAFTAVFLWGSFRPFLAERHYREGYNAHSMAEEGGRTERFKVAEEELLQAVKYFPWETTYLVKLGKVYEDWFLRAQNDEEKKYLLGKAVEIYQRCVNYQPLNPWYLNRLATMHTYQNQFAASDDEKRRNMEKAEDLIVKAAAADRNNPLFQVNAGFFKHRIGKSDEALKYYQRAIAIDDGLFDAWFNLGDLYVRNRQWDLAKQTYDFISSKDPSYNNLHLNIGRMYQEMGNVNQALAEFAREAEINPNNIQAYINRSYLFIDRRDWRSAARELETALERDSNQVELRYNLAVSYMNLGEFNRARQQLEEVLRRNPGYEKAQQTMGILNRMRSQ